MVAMFSEDRVMVRSAEELTYPELFRTNWGADNDPEYQAHMLEQGRDTAEEFGVIYILANGAWTMQLTNETGKVQGHVESFSRLGYHAGMAWFLKGLLQGISPVVYVDNHGEHHAVKGSGYLKGHTTRGIRL